jgi:hypothetical protein
MTEDPFLPAAAGAVRQMIVALTPAPPARMAEPAAAAAGLPRVTDEAAAPMPVFRVLR